MAQSVLKESLKSGSPAEAPRLTLERYERAALAGGSGLWDWDLSTGLVWYSASLKQLLGYGAADVFPNTFAGFDDHLDPDQRSLLLHSVRRHLEQHHALDFECQMRTRGGEVRWFHLRGAAERDQAGHPLRLSGSMRDVTQQHRHEEVARHAEDLQRRALDALHVAVGVLNSKGEIVEINRSWREFSSDHGLIGMRYSFGESYPLLCEKAVDRCRQGPDAAIGIREVLAGHRPAFSITYHVPSGPGNGGNERYYELRAIPFNEGTPSDRSVADVPGPDPDSGSSGAARGVFVIHMDVSATREAYAALEDSRDFYERILNAIPIQIAYVDKDQRILYMNESYERWFQLPLATMRGRYIREMTSVLRYRDTAQRVESVLAGRIIEFEQRATRADGSVRELAVTYVPHRDLHQEIIGFLSIVRDVTEQKRLEASLRQSQKMEAVGQLTGGVAHDFNNLLSVIIGNLQLLERPLHGHDRLLKQVQTALRASLRGADLTRRLLAFARQTALEPCVLNVNELIQGMQELLRRSLGREIEIRSQLTADPWPVRIDPGQFENCILNLAINARDAMPKGGTVTIETCNLRVDAEVASRHPELRQADYLLVSVSDTGSGMTLEVAKRAFEPFFTTKAVGKGTGLGLSMVYGFLEQSGGLATIYSEPGCGTTLKLYFPRAAHGGPGGVLPVKPAESVVAKAPRGTETVLVVEDDSDVRATALRALRSFGYRVLEAGSAAEALVILKSSAEIDLLFSDVTLPGGIHGPALAQQARQLRPTLKILFTSGFSESAVIHRGLLDGTLAMISKPYAIVDLARRVRSVLDRPVDGRGLESGPGTQG